MVLTLADMDGQETFEASALGTAAEVSPLCTRLHATQRK